MAKIVIPYKMYPSVVEYLQKYAEVDCFNDQISQEELLKIIDRYDAIMNRGVIIKINEELVRKAKNLKVIGMCRVGLNDVAVDVAKELGIAVYNSGDSSASAVAEITMLHLLNLSRKFIRNINFAKEGMWQSRTPVGSFELYGRTLGIAGFGNIGRKVAAIAKVFGMNIIAYDPFLKDSVVEGIHIVNFDELLRQSDYISIHCPLTPDTINLFDSDALEKMKKGAYLINIARGKIVDEDALYDALISGHLAGAGLDAIASEPMEKGYKLSMLENVYITPHVGDCAENTQIRIAMYVAEKVLTCLGCK